MTVDRTIAEAYEATYRGPQPGAVPNVDESGALGASVTPALIAAQQKLAHRRRVGETLVEVYSAEDPGGFGPALQVVTDQATMLMDSVTVLLHRLGVGYVALMHPAVRVRRDVDGTLLEVRVDAGESGPDAIDESWIHIRLAKSVDRRALAEAVRLLPMVVADARQVANDSAALAATVQTLADDIDADNGERFRGPDRGDVADLLRWLAGGHFVLLGAQRCAVRDGQATVDESSRLGVARLRTEVLPELSEPGDLLVLAQATMPSFLRYGAYPYIVVVREQSGGPERSDSGSDTATAYDHHDDHHGR